MSKLAVAVTAYNRPEYLRRVIGSWQKATLHKPVPFLFQVEPECAEVIQICQRAGLFHKQVRVNDYRQGVLLNPKVALASAFEGDADFVVLGEDDTIVSPDVLNYFQFAADQYRESEDIFVVCTFTPRPIGKPDEMFRQRWFGSPVWGIWRDRWERLEPYWPMGYSPAWDQYMIDHMNASQTWAIFPSVSRSQLIGKYGGVHFNPDEFEATVARRFYEGRRIHTFKEVLYE